MSIKDELFSMQDKKYRDFQAKLFPTLDSNIIIGVRTPDIKKLAKRLYKENNYKSFIEDLPHKYFDENQLHAFIISEIKDYDECILYINKFLPYVFKKNTSNLLKQIKIWVKSKYTYTIRFGIGILMQYFLDDEFKVEYLDMVCNIKSNEYYVNMMRAWYFATALAKQYNFVIPYIEQNKLDDWTHNKTIQKAIESYRITNEQKQYLKGLKRK